MQHCWNGATNPKFTSLTSISKSPTSRPHVPLRQIPWRDQNLLRRPGHNVLARFLASQTRNASWQYPQRPQRRPKARRRRPPHRLGRPQLATSNSCRLHVDRLAFANAASWNPSNRSPIPLPPYFRSTGTPVSGPGSSNSIALHLFLCATSLHLLPGPSQNHRLPRSTTSASPTRTLLHRQIFLTAPSNGSLSARKWDFAHYVSRAHAQRPP